MKQRGEGILSMTTTQRDLADHPHHHSLRLRRLRQLRLRLRQRLRQRLQQRLLLNEVKRYKQNTELSAAGLLRPRRAFFRDDTVHGPVVRLPGQPLLQQARPGQAAENTPG